MEIPMKVKKQSAANETASRESQLTSQSQLKRKRAILKNVKIAALCTSTLEMSCGVGDFPEIWSELRTNMQLCDGVVRCEDEQEFKVHRAILSAVSPYFKALFTNSINRGQPEETEASVDIPADIFSSILDFAYTGKVLITNENVQNLMIYSDQLEILDIVKLCTHYITSNLCHANCFPMWKLAKQYFLKDLEAVSGKYMRHYFVQFQESPNYCHLSVSELYDILSDDDLNLKNEEAVFKALTKWVMHDSDIRKFTVPKLLECIRFGLMSATYFNSHVIVWPYVQANEDCVQKLQYIMDCLADPRRDVQLYSDYRDKLNKSRTPFEILFAFGGWSDGSPIGFIETYDSKADRWVPVSSEGMGARAYHGLCTLDGLIYLVGGFDGAEHFNTVRSLNPVTGEWREHACMYYPRCYVSVATHNKKIYAIGGYNGKHRMTSVERYDPESNQWELLAPMNLPRSDASAAVLRGKVYVVGGFSGNEVMRTAEMYDPAANQWSLVCPMCEARSGVSLVAHDGYLYALGGFDGEYRLASVERYAPEETWCWEPVAGMHSPRSNFAAELMENMIYVVGGFDGKGTISRCECYDFITNTWFVIHHMSRHRSALSACVMSGLPNAKEYSANSLGREVLLLNNQENIKCKTSTALLD